jgi:hypothetical protein
MLDGYTVDPQVSWREVRQRDLVLARISDLSPASSRTPLWEVIRPPLVLPAK